MASRIGILSRSMVAAFLLCGWLFTPAHAEKRVALVIGNSAYQAAPRLPNPASDARLMSDTLLSLGFFVVGGGAGRSRSEAESARDAAVMQPRLASFRRSATNRISCENRCCAG
jgi:hypothetical protein